MSAEADDTVAPEPGATDRTTAPGWVVWSLIVLATIVGMGATLNSWIDRQADRHGAPWPYAGSMVNPVGAWALSLGALALSLLLAPGITIARWLPALVLVVLFVTAVELLRRQITRQRAAAAVVGS